MREQSFVFFSCVCVGQFFKELAKITVRLKVVGLGRLYQGIKGGAGFRSFGVSGKQPVLAAYDERPDRILRKVVVRGKAAVIRISNKPVPLVYRIADGLAE